MNSPADIQQEVFRRQLKHAVRLGKPLTIHTREADDDVERILKEEVPQEYKVRFVANECDHSAYFLVDSHSLLYGYTRACSTIARLLPEPLHWHHWLSSSPCYFGNHTQFFILPGVVTYKTNQNTSGVIRALAAQSRPRILLEVRMQQCCQPNNGSRGSLQSDAPYMVPTNLYGSLDLPKKSSSPRLAFCHSGMLPWVAEFIAEVSNSSRDEKDAFDTGHVLELCRENARRMYLDA